jgi:hypothetical protein
MIRIAITAEAFDAPTRVVGPAGPDEFVLARRVARGSAATGRPWVLHALGVEPVNKIGGVADFEGIKANIPFVPLGLRNEETEDVHARAAALLGL